MSIRILFFGELADIAEQCFQASEITRPADQAHASLITLEETLSVEHPTLGSALKRGEHLRSVNQVMQHQDCELNDGDEVALMSPFSGG